MNNKNLREQLVGCYVTIPTQFSDHDLELDLDAMRQHVDFVIAGGVQTGTGVLLAGGAAGDFSTMTFDERLRVASAVVEAADGRVPVAMGAQTTSTRELVALARAAEKLGATYIQVSAPFYFNHTQDDFYEYVRAAAEAAHVGLIVYNTYWTSCGLAPELIDRLLEFPNMAGLKWAVLDRGRMAFESVVTRFSSRLSIIDNQNRYVTSHILGARAIELHICNHWPQWGVRLWQLLEAGKYAEAQQEMVRVSLPFLSLWSDMEQYTGGDGYLDKLCMELVGCGSSRCRPPTRDVRDKFRQQVRQMLIATGTAGVVGVPKEKKIHSPAMQATV